MGQISEKILHKRKYTNGHLGYETMLNMTSQCEVSSQIFGKCTFLPQCINNTTTLPLEWERSTMPSTNEDVGTTGTLLQITDERIHGTTTLKSCLSFL